MNEINYVTCSNCEKLVHVNDIVTYDLDIVTAKETLPICKECDKTIRKEITNGQCNFAYIYSNE